MPRKLVEILQDIEAYNAGPQIDDGQVALENLYHLTENLMLLNIEYDRRLEALERDLRMRQPFGPIIRQPPEIDARALNAAAADMISKAIAAGRIVPDFDGGTITIKK